MRESCRRCKVVWGAEEAEVLEGVGGVVESGVFSTICFIFKTT